MELLLRGVIGSLEREKNKTGESPARLLLYDRRVRPLPVSSSTLTTYNQNGSHWESFDMILIQPVDVPGFLNSMMTIFGEYTPERNSQI